MRFLLLLISCLSLAQSKQTFYFDFNQSKLNTHQLELVTQWTEEHPQAIIEKMEGYCDWIGNNSYNDTLALLRIETIQDKMRIENITISDSVKKIGYGKRHQQSIAQWQNRKVVVHFLEDVEVKQESNISQKGKLEIIKLDSVFAQKEVGETIILKNLNFYNRSGVVVPESRPILKELLDIMRANPNLKIEIQGHICCQLGYDDEDIGKVRALAVYQYLLKNGISKERILYKSFGSSKPLYKIPEKNDFERDANRRVEILILEK